MPRLPPSPFPLSPLHYSLSLFRFWQNSKSTNKNLPILTFEGFHTSGVCTSNKGSLVLQCTLYTVHLTDPIFLPSKSWKVYIQAQPGRSPTAASPASPPRTGSIIWRSEGVLLINPPTKIGALDARSTWPILCSVCVCVYMVAAGRAFCFFVSKQAYN